MIVVFFIYGMSFFLLGVVVLLRAQRDSGFWVERHLWLLAAFGLLHGLNEWLDMFLLIGTSQWSESAITSVTICRFFVGQVSYLLLLQFGIALVLHGRNRCSWCSPAVLCAYTAFIIGFAFAGWRSDFSRQWFLISDVTMRYIVAFPGGLLTGIGFLRERRNPEIVRLKASAVHWGLTGLGVSFCLYAVLAGLVVKPATFFPASVFNYENFTRLTTLPVQVFRAACAIAALTFAGKALRVFDFRTRRELATAYREIIQTSNREQARIGQDLHDGLGQQLAGIAYMSKILEKRLGERLPEEASTARQIREDLDDAIDITRGLARGLHPATIEQHGLSFALREMAENTERVFGLHCIPEIDAEIVITDNAAAAHLFRIAQEAVSNAARHAGASTISVGLHTRGKEIELSVQDDGCGIAAEANAGNGIGLQIMHYRAEVTGATLDIASRPGRGTVVRAVLPRQRTRREPYPS